MGQGRFGSAAAPESRCARAWHAVMPQARARPVAHPLWAYADASVDFAGRRNGRGKAGLRNDPALRHARHLPDRKPRADVDAATTASGKILRSGDRSSDRTPRTNPGKDGASLSAGAREIPRHGNRTDLSNSLPG